MQSFDVTQKLLSIGATYQVRRAASENVLFTIKGKLLTLTPKLTVTDPQEKDVAKLTANLTRTRFVVSGDVSAELEFPLIALKKRFLLRTTDREYRADGGYLAGVFRCLSPRGEVAFEIRKELALRDQFSVQIHDEQLGPMIVVLAAVAIDQKYFQDSGAAYVD